VDRRALPHALAIIDALDVGVAAAIRSARDEIGVGARAVAVMKLAEGEVDQRADLAPVADAPAIGEEELPVGPEIAGFRGIHAPHGTGHLSALEVERP